MDQQELRDTRQALQNAQQELRKTQQEFGNLQQDLRDTAEEDLGDLDEYVEAAGRTLPTFKRGYTSKDGKHAAEQLREMFNIISAVNRKPEFRVLSRKAVMTLASLAETTSFMMDVGEYEWRDLISLAAAAHAYQWTPDEDLPEGERKALMAMLKAYGKSGRDLMVPLQMATYLKAMNDEEREEFVQLLAEEDRLGLRGLRMGMAVYNQDFPALIEAYGGEPQTPDGVFNLILEILDHDMDEEALMLTEMGLAMDPPPHLESMFTELREGLRKESPEAVGENETQAEVE